MIAVLCFFWIELRSLRGHLQTGETHTLQLAQKLVESVVTDITADAQYLAGSATAINWLTDGTDSQLIDVQNDLLNFAAKREVYDQVRIIDLNGHERVRINKQPHGYVIAKRDTLQDKSSRYYVQEGLRLTKGEVYMSPFDLNIEHEQVQQPIKPMIRLVAPIYDHQQKRVALLVLNFLGADILNELNALGKAFSSELWLLNNDGYWLLGPDRKAEWGFMFDHLRQSTFGTDYSKDWETLKAVDSGYFDNPLGLISFQKIHLRTAARSPHTWIILSRIPHNLYTMPQPTLKRYLLATALLTLLLAIVSIMFAYKERARRTNLKRVFIEQSRFRNLLESAPDCIIIVDKNGIITSANRKADQEFGYSSGELIGSPIERIIPARHHDKHHAYREQFIRNPITRPMGEGKVLFGLRKDQTEFPVEVSLSSTTIDDVQSVTAIVRNVSTRIAHERDIKILNETLQSRTQELEMINRELESFSYSVSHDLRAPLRAMDGFSLTLLNDYGQLLDPRGHDRLLRIRAAAQKMAALIDDLLMLSRISRIEMRFQSLDLSVLAREIVQEIIQNSPPREVSVHIEDNLLMYGDTALMKIALTNLIANAWKFTSKTPDPRIDIGQDLQNEQTVFYVRDNGAGFDMNYAANLFGAFQRLHDNEEFPGTGIGLATVKRVINRHSGNVWAVGRVNFGAIFYFTFNHKGPE
jgi:PAS domain S-box-containing protein